MARMTWIAMASVVVAAALTQPWRAGSGSAEARPAARPAACKADEVARLHAELAVARLRAELADTRRELAEARADADRARATTVRLLDAEQRRAMKLAEQLGSPMIETLKGAEPPR